MSSSDKSDSEDSDEEVRLYTQLYFGSEIESNNNLQSTTNKEFFYNDQPNKELISQLGSRSNANMKINEAEMFSSNFKNEYENIVSFQENPVISGTTKKTLSDVITPKTINTLSKPLTPKKIKTQLKIVPPKKDKVDIAKDAKKSKRKRNPSICSIDSISGREPLDNLYCQIDELEIIYENLLNEPHCDESYLANRSHNKNKLAADEPESKISEIIKSSHSKKKKLQNEVDTDSSDEEICVLPLNQRNILPISNVEVSDDSIEIVKCIEQNKTKIKKKKKVVSRIKQKNNSSGSLTVSENSPGSLNISDSENEIEMSPKTPIVFKLGSRVFSTVEKKKTLRVKKFSKSCVIFSKNRPLTKKTPSCHQWTLEMASFYDSDYSDEFSVEDIHNSQNKNPRLWKICNQDNQWTSKKNRRYFDHRCTRCREFGHLVDSCTKIPHCLFCASPDHNRYRCPKKCCFYCGKEPHNPCNLAFLSNTCSECMQRGHVASICPDSWRRFHATTSGTVPVVPDKPSITNRKDAYCYNCAKKGHFGHECRLRNDVNEEFKLRFPRVSTQIFNYDTPNPVPEGEISEIIVSDKDDDDDIEILSPAKKFVTNSSVNNKPSIGISLVNEPQPDITTLVTITPIQVQTFIKRKKQIEKEIRKLVKSRLEYITLKKEEYKISFKGPSRSVQCAKKIALFLTQDPLNYRYKSLLKKFNKEQKMIQEYEKTNNSDVDQGESPIYVERKPVKILIESGFNSPVWPPEGKEVGSKNKKDCLTSSTSLKTPKLSTGGLNNKKNNKKSYLPFPLPFSKGDIQKALFKTLMCIRSNNLLSIVEEIFLNSNRNVESLSSDPKFLYNFQLLACVAHFQLYIEKKPCAIKYIKQYLNELKFLEYDTVSEAFHKKISMSYSKIASPDVKHIYLYLELAGKFRDNLPIMKKQEIMRLIYGVAKSESGKTKVKKKKASKKKS